MDFHGAFPPYEEAITNAWPFPGLPGSLCHWDRRCLVPDALATAMGGSLGQLGFGARNAQLRIGKETCPYLSTQKK